MAIYEKTAKGFLFRVEDLTIKQVDYRIRQHDRNSQEFFDIYGIKPLYKGSLVLNWLGY